MNDLIVSMAIIMFSMMGMLILSRSLAGWERPLVWASAFFHMISAVCMILLTKYFFGGGDLFAYQFHGQNMAEFLYSDFFAQAPDFWLYLIGKDTGRRLAFEQTSTGSMIALSAWLHGPLLGSLYGKCILLAMLGVPSKYLIYKGIASFFSARAHRAILIACMLLPSTVFWTSGMLKEPIAMLGMGPLVYGTSLLIHGKLYLRALILTCIGAFIISIFKAYILFPWVVAMMLCYYWHRQVSQGKRPGLLKNPIYLVIVMAMSVGGIIALGEIFPRYSISSLSDEINNLQTIGQRIGGGSNYSLGTPAAGGSSAQLSLLPLGLFFSLFRPFFFEVRNAALLLNALETTFFLAMWVRMFWVKGPRQIVRTIFATPGLIGAVVFVLLFGAVVGIATSNVGTLSRYRIPMMPFYVSVLFLLNLPTSARQSVATRQPRRRRSPRPQRPTQGGSGSRDMPPQATSSP